MTTTAESEFLLIEKDRPFSRSLLWQMQRSYYEQQGVKAFNRASVPNYITNNPVIAAAYARITLAYLRDCLTAGQLDPTRPFYLLELGAGSGRFAYHFLKYLLPALPGAGLANLRICYVLSDLAENSLTFWAAHPSLLPFVQSGALDFARYDPTRDSALHLRIANGQLAPANPLVVFANYFFDSIPQDIFHIDGGLLRECLPFLAIRRDLLPQGEPITTHPELLSQLRLSFRPHFTSPDYYPDVHCNSILAAYVQRLNGSYLQFPTAALDVLRRLYQLSQGRLLFLTSDRGYCTPEALPHPAEPEVSLHSSAFSMEVNFDAIAQYVNLIHSNAGTGWSNAAHHRQEGLVTFLALLDAALPDAPQAAHAFQECFLYGGPDDFFEIKRAVQPHLASFSLEQLLALLRFSGYDSNLFEKMFPALIDMVGQVSIFQHNQLYDALTLVRDNFYPIGEPFDHAFALARLFATISCYADALDCLHLSAAFYPGTPERDALLALCQNHIFS